MPLAQRSATRSMRGAPPSRLGGRPPPPVLVRAASVLACARNGSSYESSSRGFLPDSASTRVKGGSGAEASDAAAGGRHCAEDRPRPRPRRVLLPCSMQQDAQRRDESRPPKVRSGSPTSGSPPPGQRSATDKRRPLAPGQRPRTHRDRAPGAARDPSLLRGRTSFKASTTQRTQRLAKAVAAAGVASRRGAEVVVGEGRVAVNGVVVTVPQTPVDLLVDVVTVDGARLPDPREQEMFYFALNKPKGESIRCIHPSFLPSFLPSIHPSIQRFIHPSFPHPSSSHQAIRAAGLSRRAVWTGDLVWPREIAERGGGALVGAGPTAGPPPDRVVGAMARPRGDPPPRAANASPSTLFSPRLIAFGNGEGGRERRVYPPLGGGRTEITFGRRPLGTEAAAAAAPRASGAARARGDGYPAPPRGDPGPGCSPSGGSTSPPLDSSSSRTTAPGRRRSGTPRRGSPR